MDARQDTSPKKEARNTDYVDPEQDEDWADLSPEEKADRKAAARLDQFTRMTDNTIDRWTEATPADQQQAIVDSIVETGTLDPEAHGISEAEAGVLVAAYTQHAERSCLAPVGLTMGQYLTYVSPEDQKALRAAAIKGDWSVMTSHARAVADHIRQHGDTNAGLY